MKRICSLSIFNFLAMNLVFILGTSCKTEDPNKPKLLPVLTTTAITKITQNTAISGGNITSDGGLEVSGRGVCWSLKPNPTINDSTTKDAAGTGEFKSNITNLIADTTYYVRAYATNSDGSAYGLQVTFKSSKSVLPIITTTNATEITDTTAISGGMIISNGGSPITVRGICWSTTQNPTTFNSKFIDIANLNIFTSPLTKLTNSTTYYIRAFATNTAGTGYGSQISFKTNSIPSLTTTSATAITLTNATSGGNITSDGGTSIIASGVCWSTSQNPTIQDNKTSNFALSGTFSSSITGLNFNTTYYLRSYATNKIGTAYGNLLSFTTQNGIIILTTTPATSITSSTSTSGGNITSDGGAAVTDRGVCWSTNANPTITNNKTSNGTGTGVFTSSITGLTVGTTYYVRSYATNGIGTSYGNQVCLTTQNGIISLTSTLPTSITSSSSTSGGNITSDGGAVVTDRGVCWSTNANPTIADNKTSNGNGTGVFTSSIIGLTVGTTYYVRSFATNNIGTAYGNQVIFTTNGTVTDIDGNLYHYITIGTQIWMVENLKTTKYRNGSNIVNVTDIAVWATLTTSAWCDYSNLATNGTKYGHLYNWYAVADTRKIAPIGWHVPTDAEWTTLTTYLGGESVAGGKLKEAGTLNWASPNTDANNSTGFSALPGGWLIYNDRFSSVGNSGYWWSSSEYVATHSVIRGVIYNYSLVDRGYTTKVAGLSVRCVRD